MSNTLLQRIHQHQTLSHLRQQLLHLHQVLLTAERITYEQVRGRVSSGELLQLVLEHAHFAWLRRLSELIVEIDQLLQADEPITPETVQTLVDTIQTLLTPSASGTGFARKYDAALQREPNAVFAHAEVSALLSTMA